MPPGEMTGGEAKIILTKEVFQVNSTSTPTAFSGTPELTFAALCLGVDERNSTVPATDSLRIANRLREQLGLGPVEPAEPPINWDREPGPQNADLALRQLVSALDDAAGGMDDDEWLNRLLDYLAVELGFPRVHGTEPGVLRDAGGNEITTWQGGD